MNMEMTLDEKIKRVSSVINEALTIQRTNPVFIPVHLFTPGELGFSNVKDIVRVIRESGAIKKMEKCWGYDELRDNQKQVFVKTSSDEAQTDEDYEVYEIAVNEKHFGTKPLGITTGTSIDEVEFDALNGVIFFGRITHAFQKGRDERLRLKLFRCLWDKRKVIKGKKIRPKGELFPASAVAVQIGLVNSPRDFEKSFEIKDKFNELLKNVESTLQKKKIPIRLYQKGGVQIVVKL